MDFDIAKEKVFLLKGVLTSEEASKKAWSKKMDMFGTLEHFASFLSKPKEEDFELQYSEHRFEPFWHIKSKAHYVYDRKNNYQIPISGDEVKKVTLHENEYETTNSHIHVPVVEHCYEDFEEDNYLDGLNGQKNSSFAEYISGISEEIDLDKISKYIDKSDIVVPPQTKVSAVMREMLARMIHGIKADEIFEEKIEVSCMDLYFRPIYSFKYLWKAKNKEAIVEVDGVNGNVKSGSKTFQEYLGKVIDSDFLFDVGADTVGMFIPGGSIAVKVAKKVFDTRKKKK